MKYLITGITGQDGLFLSSKLLEKDSQIYGLSRSNNTDSFYSKLATISNSKQFDKISILNVNLSSQKEVSDFIGSIQPDYIFNFSGPSSVYDSYKNPSEYKYLITQTFDNLIKGCKENKIFPNFFQASSSEMFAENDIKINELCPFDPKSPYAEAKLNIHYQIQDLRNKYSWKINSGIMFNHESEFRNDEYLIMKIIKYAKLIKSGTNDALTLGSLDLIRDWSYAKDVVEASYLINHYSNGGDYVIGSGVGNSIKHIVDLVFGHFSLNYEEYLKTDKKLLRPDSPKSIISNPEKIHKEFNWSAKIKFDELIYKCIESRNNP